MLAETNTSKRVLRLRIKDKHVHELRVWAGEVNFVWNYCNELSFKVWDRERRFLSGFELQAYVNGATKAGLAIPSVCFQQIAEEYATRRKQHKKVHLSWRKSGGARRSLGWIPFKARALAYKGGQVRFNGRFFGLWDSYGLGQFALRSGCFSEDSRGRWYLNIVVEVERVAKPPHEGAVGVDLGLKDLAALSTGERIEAKRFYRDLEPALAVAQRAGKGDRARAIYAKIRNRRNDFLHKKSTELVRQNGAIFVGNVTAAGVAKTRMAKSVLDAGWSTFRTMLRYKCDDAGAWFEEVNEAYSSQTCSACLARSGPKGIAGLGIREWSCVHCGTVHDRDINAARNILAAGHGRLAEGIPRLSI